VRLSFRRPLPPPNRSCSSLARSLVLAGGFTCLLFGVRWTAHVAAEPLTAPANNDQPQKTLPATTSPATLEAGGDDFRPISASARRVGSPATTSDDPAADDFQPLGATSKRRDEGNIRQAAATDEEPVGPQLPAAKLPIFDTSRDADPKGKKKDSEVGGELIPVLPTPQAEPFDRKTLDPRSIVLLAAARNAVARGELAEAIARFEEYLQLQPADREARKEYAGVLVQAERHKQALEVYKKLIAAEPDNLTLLVNAADVYLFMKDFRKAANYLTTALEKAPTNIEYAIKLSRANAFDGDMPRAFQIFDRYLAKFKNDDARLPKSYGALLIDLGQIETAIPFLLALRARTPEDMDVLAALLRAYARQGDRFKSFEIVNTLAELKPAATPIRLELAESLYQATDLEMAALIYGQVLKTEPNHALANVGLARVYLSQFLPKEAARILLRVNPAGEARRRGYLFAWAEYHQTVGEYTQAKQIYRSFLNKDEEDNEARLSLARLYAFTREDEIAKAEFSKVSTESSLARQARYGIVSTLIVQRRFAEALGLCRHMMRDFPSDGTWRALSAQVMSKSGAAPDAEAVCRDFLRNETRNKSAIAEVQLALGKVLLDRGETAGAATEFELALSLPFGRVASGFYGLARARARLGSQEAGQSALEACVRLLGKPRGQLLLADQFVVDHEDEPAADYCEAVLQLDPANLAAMIRLVDIRQRQSTAAADISATVTLAEAMLQISPKNVRAQLALARAYSIAKKFKLAVRAYDDLIVADGTFKIPKRERARILYSDHAFRASQAAYAELAHAAIPEVPRPDRDIFGAINPGNGLAYAGAHDGMDILHGEIPLLNSPVPIDPEALPPFQRMLAESTARRANSTAAELEGRAKSLKGWRNYASIPVYQQLIAQEPSNTEGLFDLAQVYASTKQTNKAIDTYQELLDADPQHREAAIAFDRANLELQPQLRQTEDFFSERGRQNLAAIDRYRYTTGFRLPYRDEDEFVEFDFTRACYSPIGGANSTGNIITFRGQLKPLPTSLVWSQVNYESYKPGSFRDRVTFDVGNQIEPCDCVRFFYAGFMENVAESAGSLAQDIYRGGVRIGGDVRPYRCWDIASNYMVAQYSDHNTLNNFNVVSNLLLSYVPCELKLVNRFDYYGYTQASVLNPNDPTNSTYAIHPYFSPRGFSVYENRLEWTQYLSRDSFTNANVCYYSLQYGIAWDNAYINYHRFRALFNYDVRPWLSIGMDANLTLSTVYQQVGATAYLVFRLPHFSR
jgi:tetratricopeptide (TPR) repeat protein